MNRAGRHMRRPGAILAGVLLVLGFLDPAGGAPVIGPQASLSTLANGATLIVSQQSGVPMVLVRVLVDAGSRRDPSGKEGLANLTADLLTEGTESQSAAAISETIEFIGGTLESSAGADHAEIWLRVLRKDLELGLDLLADVLLRPAFAAVEVERRRDAVLASIRSARDNPADVAHKAFNRALFGSGPYGHPTEGTEESVPAISRRDVTEFYRRNYLPGTAGIIVVGDVDVDSVRGAIERALGGWSGALSPDPLRAAPVAEAADLVRIDRPVTQATIILGHIGIARNDPDYEAVSVMNYILGGGGFSSRLMDSIRIEAGLAYSVASVFSATKDPGAFRVVMQTKNDSVAQAIARARREIERMRSEPVGEDELNDAKRYLIGSFPLRLDSNSKIASFLAQTWFYGLGLDYASVYAERIEGVTREDVLRVAERLLHPDRLIEVVVADLARAELPEGGEREANPAE
jgi:zinc protease